MKKKLFFLIVILFISIAQVHAQCSSITIPKTGWSIHSFSTQETTGEGANNGRAIHSIDDNLNTFWHSKWQGSSDPYPHEIVYNLGQVYPVDGFSVTSRNNSGNNKPKTYELYFSTDGTNWTTVQSAGNFIYPSQSSSGQTAAISFGAVNTQYIKLIITSNYDNSVSCAISEVNATQLTGTGCVATGQNNQILSFETISKKYTTDAPFTLQAATNSSLPTSFVVVSGPATVSGNTLTLSGTAGTVVVKAFQEGNPTYYAVEATQSFEVVDLSIIQPEVHSRLTDLEPIQMPNALQPYLLYANATIDEPTALNISNIQFFVDGVLQTSSFSNNSYKCWWTPSSYGTHIIEMIATGSNGNTATKTTTVNVVNTATTNSFQAFDNDLINFDGTGASQWFYGTYTLPQYLGAYNSIIANFSVTCPSVAGDCDDWDRLAWVEIKNPDGDWVELFRYITPYGVACSHSIDVTDYESLLQGTVEFRMYIETWGSGGWNLNLNLSYTAGTPTYLYSTVEEIWQGNYNFGDMANLQPVPEKSIVAPTNTSNAKFRLVTTGHGWGNNNSGNAAEFYSATHKLQVNGVNTYNQLLWTACNPNPDSCTGQMGTWQYNRAGWCPGTIPHPFTYDVTPHIGAPFNFKYQFKTTYVDLCHPNNPNCISGTTCANCNDGYNPHYRVGGYMIYSGNAPLQPLNNPTFETPQNNFITVYPNSNNGIFKINLKNDLSDFVVSIYTISGQSLKTYYFKNKLELDTFTFNLTDISKGTYFIKAYNKHENYAAKVIIN